ncbi:UDP-N-acetylglucosamine acyltransferase [Achromobacter anxifer]
MHPSKLFGVVVVAAVLTGCQSVPPLNFSVPDVGYSQKKIDAELKSITVSLGRPDEKTGELPAAAGPVVPPLWQNALVEALNRMAVFKDDATTKLNLSVKVLKLDIPSAGVNFETHTEAKYELINRANGDIVYTQNISSMGSTPMNYAFLGAARQMESVNRSVQNNIAQFLQSLDSVDPGKPMFPTSAPAPAASQPASGAQVSQK